jgi:hypothetical protein
MSYLSPLCFTMNSFSLSFVFILPFCAADILLEVLTVGLKLKEENGGFCTIQTQLTMRVYNTVPIQNLSMELEVT